MFFILNIMVVLLSLDDMIAHQPVQGCKDPCQTHQKSRVRYFTVLSCLHGKAAEIMLKQC